MHQRPAEGLLRKDNMIYPRERDGEKGGERQRGETNRQALREEHRLDGDRGGNERVSNEDLTRVYHLQYAVN